MNITLKTKSFNLNELMATSCYTNFCTGGKENNDEISFIINEGKVQDFNNCLKSKEYTSVMQSENITKEVGLADPVVAANVQGLKRTIQMIKEVQTEVINQIKIIEDLGTK